MLRRRALDRDVDIASCIVTLEFCAQGWVRAHPALRQAMKPYFTCSIEGGGSGWQAICIDVDLSISSRSKAEVMELLEYAVRTYVGDALAEAEPARSRLLNRRAPWTTRARWHSRLATARIGVKRGPPFEEARYALPCPA